MVSDGAPRDPIDHRAPVGNEGSASLRIGHPEYSARFKGPVANGSPHADGPRLYSVRLHQDFPMLFHAEHASGAVRDAHVPEHPPRNPRFRGRGLYFFLLPCALL